LPNKHFPENYKAMHPFYKAIKIGIAIAIGGVTIIAHTEFATSDEEHSSLESATTQEHAQPLKTPTEAQAEQSEEYIEHFRVPTLTTKEFIVERILNQGLEKLDKKNNEGALQDFNKALLINPSHERARRLRGDLLRGMGENQRAIDDYTQAIEQNPTFSSTYLNRGNAYQALGNYKKAIEDYTKTLELYPEDGFGYSSRGAVYSKIGDNQKAMDDLNKAIKLNPGRSEAYLNRGNLYAKLGDLKKAKEAHKEATTFYKKATADYQQAAKLFSEQGYLADSQKVMSIMQALQQ
jgi:tetratricopeptide (TPR) repeat protein